MRIIKILLLNIYFLSFIAIDSFAIKMVDNNTWNDLLNEYVSEGGQVDYKGFQKEKDKLNSYLNSLKENFPDKSWSENEKLAYWINAYNAFTVALIIDHYPLKSIMKIDNAWDIKFIELGNKVYSLNEIEHEVIRKKFEESRIHFVLVCAAQSCPVLLNKAYEAPILDQQLQQQGERFINDPAKNSIATDKIKVSQIFNWFKEDFTKQGSLIDFLNQFSKTEIAANAKIEYLQYNWDLNE